MLKPASPEEPAGGGAPTPPFSARRRRQPRTRPGRSRRRAAGHGRPAPPASATSPLHPGSLLALPSAPSRQRRRRPASTGPPGATDLDPNVAIQRHPTQRVAEDHVDVYLAGGSSPPCGSLTIHMAASRQPNSTQRRPIAPGWSAARPAPKRSIGAYGRPAEASRSAAATTSTSGRPRSSASSYRSGSDGRL